MLSLTTEELISVDGRQPVRMHVIHLVKYDPSYLEGSLDSLTDYLESVPAIIGHNIKSDATRHDPYSNVVCGGRLVQVVCVGKSGAGDRREA